MTTLTPTGSTPRFIHLRAYLAGAGATGALVAGAAIVLLSVATFLGFNGLPFGGSGGESGNAYLRSAAGVPAATAAALGAAPGAVSARPAAGAATGGGAGGGLSSGPGAGGPRGGVTQSAGPTSPSGSTPPGGCTTGCTEPTQPGPVTKAVQGADDTLGTDVSGSTGDVTGQVESTGRQTLNDVGGAVGNPGLGDQVTQLGDQVTQTGNRLADGLLP